MRRGSAGETRDDLLAQLARGEAIVVDGQRLSPALFAGLVAAAPARGARAPRRARDRAQERPLDVPGACTRTPTSARSSTASPSSRQRSRSGSSDEAQRPHRPRRRRLRAGRRRARARGPARQRDACCSPAACSRAWASTACSCAWPTASPRPVTASCASTRTGLGESGRDAPRGAVLRSPAARRVGRVRRGRPAARPRPSRPPTPASRSCSSGPAAAGSRPCAWPRRSTA